MEAMSGSERRVTRVERIARVNERHLLGAGTGAETAQEVVERLVALHATDPATVYLSVAARLREPGSVFAQMDEALYGEPPALARMLAMRRTMFVVTRRAAPAVYAAAGQHIAARERKGLLAFLAEGGGWDEHWLAEVEAEVEEALAKDGESSGTRLSQSVPRLREKVVVARGKPYEATQNVASRIIRTMAAEGRIERRRPAGSWTSGQFRWARARPLPRRPVEEARAEVVAAWLAAYGPGTDADLKWWTGWNLGEVRKALAAVGAQPVVLDEGSGWMLPEGHPAAAKGTGAAMDADANRDRDRAADTDTATDTDTDTDTSPAARLLPALDPTPMGWQYRDWFLPREHRAALFDRTGNVGPTVWWGGEVIGGWAQRPDGVVVWRPLADRGKEAADAVEECAARLTALLGGARITPRFRTPLERELSGS
jgi:hypothetical protein